MGRGSPGASSGERILQRAGDLEREQWVATRCLVDASEERPGKGQVETLPEHSPDRSKAERPDPNPLDAGGVEDADQIQRRAMGNPVGCEHGDRLVAESPERVLERVRGGTVEPMQIVQGE